MLVVEVWTGRWRLHVSECPNTLQQVAGCSRGGPALAFLRECPGVGYGTAVSLAAHFRGRKISHLLRCGAADLLAAAPWLSAKQRRNLLLPSLANKKQLHGRF
jgi:hypothetical protein